MTISVTDAFIVAATLIATPTTCAIRYAKNTTPAMRTAALSSASISTAWNAMSTETSALQNASLRIRNATGLNLSLNFFNKLGFKFVLKYKIRWRPKRKDLFSSIKFALCWLWVIFVFIGLCFSVYFLALGYDESRE